MVIYIVNFIINMLLGLMIVPQNMSTALLDVNRYNYKKKIYLLITTIQLGLLCGFRSVKVAYDTGAYELIFNQSPNSWGTIFNNEQYIEIGFSVLCSLIKILGGDFQTLLILSSLFVVGCCCIFIYRHSCNVVLSVFIIICFPFYYSTFDIIRHFIAISFLFLGYKYILKKKFFKYLLFLLIGSLFHKITLLFIPLYFIGKIKYSLSTLVVSMVVMFLSFIFMDKITQFISVYLDKNSAEGWVGEYGGGIKTAIMYAIIFVIALFLYICLKKKEIEDNVALNFIMLLLFASIVFIRARMMTRIIMTLVPFLAIAMPRLLVVNNAGNIEDRDKCFIIFVAIGIIYHMFMLLSNWQNIIPYIPYWA